MFADGPVDGATVLVHGALGGVRALAAQIAAWGGASVLGTVLRRSDLDAARRLPVSRVVALEEDDPADLIREAAPDGVDRIIEVAFSDNVELDAAVAKVGTVIAAYATRQDRPEIPFWPMLFANMTIRLLGSDDFPDTAKKAAATDLTRMASTGALSIPSAPPLPLARAADAHDRVDADTRERVLLEVDL